MPISITYQRYRIAIRMNFKKENYLPSHLRNENGLPRSQEERLLWIRQRVEDGYYESHRIKQAVAEAFLEPKPKHRAGGQVIPEN